MTMLPRFGRILKHTLKRVLDLDAFVAATPPIRSTFLSYADSTFAKHQMAAAAFAKREGFQELRIMTATAFQQTDFYRQHNRILDYLPNKGAGFCLWKPYYILETLCQMRDREILVYSDCGDAMRPGIRKFVLTYLQQHDYLLVQNTFTQSHYTKRDCFVYMNCDSEAYWNAKQLEAGFCAFVKTQGNISFVEEWLTYCADERVLVTKANVCGVDNLPGYVDHRYDQSVLTNLALKHGMKTIAIARMTKYIRYNAHA